MKKNQIVSLLLLCAVKASAQLLVSDFETFTLSPNTFYEDTNSISFGTQNASFQHRYSKFGSSWFWTGGFAYTNVNDSTNGTFTNLYGVKAYKGYNGSNNFVVAQDRATIYLASTQNTVDGFYVTNTTYAYKMMLLGDTANGFSRRFGDTTGTGSGTNIAQGAYPDYFKLTVKGYKNGQISLDSVEFYLADYRSANSALDYIVDTWQWVNTASLGEVDSLKFWMYSSDVGQFGVNTPLFFALDNFTTHGLVAGWSDVNLFAELKVYPVPFHDQLNIDLNPQFDLPGQLRLLNMEGKCVMQTEIKSRENHVDLSNLSSGVYLLELSSGESYKHLKIVKE